MSMSSLEKSYYATLVSSVSELVTQSPWQTLEPTDVFAVRSPNSDELLFVQVNGGDGAVPVIMAYRGARGLEMLWELNNSENPAFVADLEVDVPALFFTFVGEEELDGLDREALEDQEGDFGGLGFPVFRSCRAGYQPAHLSEDDVFLMLQVVRQLQDVVRAVNDGSLDFSIVEGEEDSYILRQPSETEDGIVWESTRIDMNLDDKLPKKNPKLKRAELTLLKGLPPGERELRVDLMVSPFVSGNESEETPSTFLFLVTDYLDGNILCARIEEPGARLPKFRETLLPTFQEVLQRMGERPRSVHVESFSLCDVLGDTLEKLSIALEHHELPPLRSAEMEAILKHLSTRFTRTPGKIVF